MDTSETYKKLSSEYWNGPSPRWHKDPIYIKMCEKAVEIQEQRNVLAFVPNGSDTICWCGADTYSDGKNGAIWLPRQDQLQEMFNFPYGTAKDWLWTLLDVIHKFGFNSKFKEWIPCSMEQLWLAFIMKEKYNKVWTNNEWRNGSES